MEEIKELTVEQQPSISEDSILTPEIKETETRSPDGERTKMMPQRLASVDAVNLKNSPTL